MISIYLSGSVLLKIYVIFFLSKLWYSYFPFKVYGKNYFEKNSFLLLSERTFLFFRLKVRHRGLTCKLIRLLPDKNMVRMIMSLKLI